MKIEEDIEKGRRWIKANDEADLTESELVTLIDGYEKACGEPGNASGLYSVIAAAFRAGIARGASSMHDKHFQTRFKLSQKRIYKYNIARIEAKRNHLETLQDVRNYVLSVDGSPEAFEAFPSSERKKAQESCKDVADVYFFKDGIIPYMHIEFSCIVFYTADKNGYFEDGSDYDGFADFTEEDEAKILDFCNS